VAVSLLVCLGAASLGCSAADERVQGEEDVQSSGDALSIPAPYLDCPSAVLDAANLVTLYVSPAGNDSNSGTSTASPLASLAGAQSKIVIPMTKDYRIYVRGGTYHGHATRWWKTNANRRIHILAFPGETPIFDGNLSGETKSRRARFFDLDPVTGSPVTNITLSGLSVRNYVHHGIRLGTTKGVPNTCNRILGNQVDNIGDAWGECHDVGSGNVINATGCVGLPNPTNNADIAAGDLSCECAPGTCLCKGYGALDLVSSSKNVLSRNVSRDLINHADTRGLIHGVYAAHASTDNLIQENYIRNCRGTPIKFRDASSNNHVIANYVESSGEGYFLTDSDQSGSYSTNVEVRDNVFTFGYMSQASGLGLAQHASSFSIAPSQSGGTLFQPNQPTQEDVTAIAVGDIDGDGNNETFVALHYPGLDFTKVVYTDGVNKTLSRVAYTSTFFKVTAMAVGNFDGTGPAEVVTAFYNSDSEETQVHRGILTDGSYALVGGGKLLDTSGSSGWKVTALAAGQFSGSVPKLYTAASVAGTTQIHRGNGVTIQSGSSSPGVADGTIVYSSSSWTVPAMTTGKIDSSGTLKLITAFHWIGSGSPKNRIYLGDGSAGSGATGTVIFDDPSWQVRALATGKLDGSATRLISAFDAGGTGKVYLSDASAQALGTSLYSNSTWSINAVAVGNLDGAGTGDEVITAFDHSSATQVHAGDGTTSATNVGEYYRWPLADPLP
jgi:hypothetical protein